MATDDDQLVFVVSIDFVSGPGVPPFRTPATAVRTEGDNIAIATHGNVTTVPASGVRSITLTPMRASDARRRRDLRQG